MSEKKREKQGEVGFEGWEKWWKVVLEEVQRDGEDKWVSGVYQKMCSGGSKERNTQWYERREAEENEWMKYIENRPPFLWEEYIYRHQF